MTEKSQDESTETTSAVDTSATKPDPSVGPPAQTEEHRDEETVEETQSAESPESAESSESAESAESSPAPESSIRWSEPTPSRPAEEQTQDPETGLSGFFDNLDDKVHTAFRRFTHAFRRPAPEGTATDTHEGPEDPEGEAQIGEAPAGAADSEAAASEAPHESVTVPETPSPVQDHASPTDESQSASTGDAPLSLPKPRRALDEQRQRHVILEKARAIEAATAQNSRPTGREYVEFADDEEDLFTYIPPYNLPSRDPDPAPTRTDLYRQIFVSVGALAALVSLFWMLGAFTGAPAILSGDGLQELADGWYSGEAALLSPRSNFYWLWPVIVLGLLAHAVFQWTTTQTSTPRQRRSGWQVGSASLLMLVWTAAVHAGMLTLATLATLATALALIDAIRQFTFRTARTGLERRLADSTTGLFAGWAMVSAMSSVSVWLTAMGWRIPGIPAVLWALLGLGLCIWAAAYYAMTERGRITIALGMGWGMFWLIFPRLLSEVASVWVAICAAMGAFIVILATESRRHRINHAERRAAMGRPLEDII